MKKIFKYIPTTLCFLISVYVTILILKEISFFNFISNFIYALKPLWFGLILTLFIYPFLHNKEKKISIIKIISVYLTFLLVILLILFIIIFLIYTNKDSLMNILNTLYPKLMIIIEEYHLEKIINLNQIQVFLINSYKTFLPLIKNIISFFTNFIFSILISFFISIDSHIFVNKFKVYVSNYEFYFKIYNIFSNILRKFIKSTFFDILYIIFTTTIILMFFKTPYAFVFASILAILNIFPYIGAIIGNGILIIVHYLLIKDNTIILFIVLLINSQIESHLVHTWICNKTMKIHPISLFVALLISEYLFGIVGIILSPILASVLQLSLMTYNEYLNQKNIGGWEKIIS